MTADASAYAPTNSIDASGAFVMPGLWDNHVHFGGGPALVDENRNLLPLYLAHGITTVRDAAGDLSENVLEWRAQVADGTLLGPTIFTSGPKARGHRLDLARRSRSRIRGRRPRRARSPAGDARRLRQDHREHADRAVVHVRARRSPAPRLHGLGPRPGRAHARSGVRGRARIDRAHVVLAARRLAARGRTERRRGRREDVRRPTRSRR